MNKHILSVLVSNQPGVLFRIAGLFSRRGYNINSITAGVTTNPDITRITIVVDATSQEIEQVVKQLEKLIDIKVVKILENDFSTKLEVVLIKILKNSEIFELMDTIKSINAQIIDLGEKTVTIQLIGNHEEIDSGILNIKSFEILEMARTGFAALERGDAFLSY
jgi:acetolactate synthase-1/3 small subunit